jgi:hypothetical protein
VPLTYTGIQCIRFSGPKGDRFSFKNFSAIDRLAGVAYESSVVNGTFVSAPYGPGPLLFK